MSSDTIVHLLLTYRYEMLVLLAFIEGPLVAFSAGYLASLGYLNPAAVLAIMVSKDITVDAICYGVGRWGDHTKLVKKYAAKIGITAEHWDKVDRLWKERPWRTMFISKLAYGLSLPFLVSAGLTGIPYKKFWFYAAQIAILQYGVLMAVGYFFGSSFSFVKNTVDILQIGIGLIALIAVVYYFLSISMRKRAMRQADSE